MATTGATRSDDDVAEVDPAPVDMRVTDAAAAETAVVIIGFDTKSHND
jgi:hypothetical protein